MENLEQEISIMRDYLHHNIVQLYEHFSSQRYIYLVLELCPGGDLSKYIRKRGRIGEPIAHGFLKQIAAGLKFLQQKNVIHRDLKPANILLSEATDAAVLKIADFGFAKQLQEAASMAQTPCGSPLYMAPEIFEMQEYDAKADVWSVGCIFYEMLVGCPPFKGSNPRELFQNIRTKQLQVPSDVPVGADSLAILRKLLERAPQRRASLDQLCEACRVITSAERMAASVGAAASGMLKSAEESGSAGKEEAAVTETQQGSAVGGLAREQGQEQGQGQGPNDSTTAADFENPRTLLSRRHSLDGVIPSSSSSSSTTTTTPPPAATPPLRVSGGTAGMVRGRSATASSGSYTGGQLHSPPPSYATSAKSPQQPSSMASSLLGIGISRAIAFIVSPQQQKTPTKPTRPPTASPSGSDPRQSKQSQSRAAPAGLPLSPQGQPYPLSLPPPAFGPVPTPVPVGSSPYQGEGLWSESERRDRAQSQSQKSASESSRRQSFAEHSRAPLQSQSFGQGQSQGPGQEQPQRQLQPSAQLRMSGSEDDFVMVENNGGAPTAPPATHPWRSSPVTTKAASNSPSPTLAPAPQVANASPPQGRQPSPRDLPLQPYRSPPHASPAHPPLPPSSPQPQSQHQSQSQHRLSPSQQFKPPSNEHPYQVLIPQTPNHEAEKAMVVGLVQRCEYVCQVLLSIVSLGDNMVREAIAQERKAARASFRGAQSGASMSVKPLRARGDSIDGSLPSFSGACAVYLHCLALLKDCIQRTTAAGQALNPPPHHLSASAAPGDLATANVRTLSHVQHGLVALFDQVIVRVEQCHKRMASGPAHSRGRSASTASGGTGPTASEGGTTVASASPSHSPPWLLAAPLSSPSFPHKSSAYTPVQSAGRITAEPLVYRAALELARNASVDELLGNLQKACDDYTAARLLVEGVMMTATDAGDRATLQQFAKTFGDQAASCRLLAESHSQILPPGGQGGGSLSLSSSPVGGAGGGLLSPRHAVLAYSPGAGGGTVAGSQLGSYMAMGSPATTSVKLQ